MNNEEFRVGVAHTQYNKRRSPLIFHSSLLIKKSPQRKFHCGVNNLDIRFQQNLPDPIKLLDKVKVEVCSCENVFSH